MSHPQRALIDRLFAGWGLGTSDWDDLFRHLRDGCESCATYYAEQRSYAAGGAGTAHLTKPEISALSKVLKERVAAKRSIRERAREWFRRRRQHWPAVMVTAGLACAALMWVRPGADPQGRAQTRGGGESATSATILCGTSGRPATYGGAAAGRCEGTSSLAVETFADATVRAGAVSVAFLGNRRQVVDLQSRVAPPDQLVYVESSVAAASNTSAVIVLWTKEPLERSDLDAALARAAPAHGFDHDKLDIPNVLAQEVVVLAPSPTGKD